MTAIGTFKTDGDGYVGTIETLTISLGDVRLEPVNKSGEKSPDYRVRTLNAEVGAAWKRTSKAGKPYVAVQLDDPTFPAPIICRLVQARGSFALLWNR